MMISFFYTVFHILISTLKEQVRSENFMFLGDVLNMLVVTKKQNVYIPGVKLKGKTPYKNSLKIKYGESNGQYF